MSWQLFSTVGSNVISPGDQLIPVVPITQTNLPGLASSVSASLTGGGYRPPQYAATSSSNPQLVYTRTNMGGYFFDAVIHLQHSTRLQITKHPVQSGAAITDHAFRHPPKLILEIGMSDCMSSFAIGQYGGGSSKSVTAYQTFVNLQNSRSPMTVVTRLQTYHNMLIESIEVREDHKTAHALRAFITLEAILIASVSTTTVPASNQTQSVSPTTPEGNTDPEENPYNGSTVPPGPVTPQEFDKYYQQGINDATNGTFPDAGGGNAYSAQQGNSPNSSGSVIPDIPPPGSVYPGV